LLEARRRKIATAGLQHGFIYRHWLNYRHEPDEMGPSAHNPADRGFPRPQVTLVFDALAAEHLIHSGCFPPEAVVITGSARLDTLVESAAALTEDDRERIRGSVGAGQGRPLVVIAAKFTQIESAFKVLIDEILAMPDVRVVVKCHPAETAAPYLRAVAGRPHVAIAPASADLAALIASARLLVTVNSTAAIEAMVLGVPSLIAALPSNLRPFVDAGVMVAARTGEIGQSLQSLLYDESVRTRLSERREAFMARYGIYADGQAARRAADTILRLTNTMGGVSDSGMQDRTASIGEYRIRNPQSR
jgi:UDP-N-acetylglucosamine 2-epimerase